MSLLNHDRRVLDLPHATANEPAAQVAVILLSANWADVDTVGARHQERLFREGRRVCSTFHIRYVSVPMKKIVVTMNMKAPVRAQCCTSSCEATSPRMHKPSIAKKLN